MGELNWLFKQGKSLIGILFCVSILSISCSLNSEESFSYLVQVNSQDTGEGISGAKVTIQVGTIAPLDAVADSDGTARIFISSDYIGHPGVLKVNAGEKYELYSKNMDIREGELPHTILLKLVNISKTPTPTSTATPTVLPTKPPTVPPTESPPPQIIGFTLFPSTLIFPNKRVSIQANVVRNNHRIDNFQWDVIDDQGHIISGQGSASIEYQTPDMSGEYKLRIFLEYQGGNVEEEFTIIVVNPQPTVEPTPEAVVASVGGLNLRSGPGENYEIIGYLNNGETLDVQGRIVSTEWIEVIPINPGTKGWVFAGLVQINMDLNSIPIVEVIPTPRPFPTDTPIPTPTLTSVTAPPTLVAPPNNTSTYVRLDLNWDWLGVLGPDNYYQIEIRNRYNVFSNFDEAVPPIDIAWVKANTYQYDQIETAYDREYKWRVIVVKGVPGDPKQWSTAEVPVWNPGKIDWMSDASEMWTLYVEPGDGPPPSTGGGSPDGNTGGGGTGGGCAAGDRSC